MAHLITGYAGYEHIKSEDDGAFNAAFFGEGQYVMEIGNKLKGSIIDNNTVRILDGDGLMYGRHFRIKPNTYEDLTISNGTAGQNRIDLIVMTYEKNSLDETEQVRLEVIKGTATTGKATTPSYTNGNILNGATKNQMPLYKLTIEGVVLRKIETLFTTLKNYKSLAESYANEFKTACQTYLNSLNVLDTMEEISANTQNNQLAGALGVKEWLSKLQKKTTWTKLSSNVLAKDGITIPASLDWETLRIGVYMHSVNGFRYYSNIVTKMMVPTDNSEVWALCLGGYSTGVQTDTGSGIDIGSCFVNMRRKTNGDYYFNAREVYFYNENHYDDALIEIEYQ